MATMLICAVRDSAVGAFSPPMYFRSKGEAIRSFLDALADANTSLSKHPRDYQMFHLGSFDDQNGMISPVTIEMLHAGEATKA